MFRNNNYVSGHSQLNYKRNCNDCQDDDSSMYENSCMCNNDSCSMMLENNMMASCGFNQEISMFPSNAMYGNSYVKNQIMNKVYTPEIALKMGTMFPELVSPYSPCDSMRVINFLKSSNNVREEARVNGSNVL